MCNCIDDLIIVGAPVSDGTFITGVNNAVLDEPASIGDFVKFFSGFFLLQDYVGKEYLCMAASQGGVKHNTLTTATVVDGDFVAGDNLVLEPTGMWAKTEGDRPKGWHPSTRPH